VVALVAGGATARAGGRRRAAGADVALGTALG